VNLVVEFGGEIISADSRQVYKYMDIGTGKDLSDYRSGNTFIPYHLIDIIDPSEEYDLYKFRKDFISAYKGITARNKMPFLVGGTGLYIHSILKGYNMRQTDFEGQRYKELQEMELEQLVSLLKSLNEDLHNTTDLLDRERTVRAVLIAEAGRDNISDPYFDFDSLVLGINMDRESLKSKITDRLRARLNEGMIEEAEALLDRGISHEKLHFFGLEYKYLSMYLKGELNYNDMFQKLNSSIHKFAKRQMTWFRKMEREGITIHWFEPNEIERAKLLISDYLSSRTI
jgi:tRNA dimethylallyltransferase